MARKGGENGIDVIQADSAKMRMVGDADVDLIVTSPPYFSKETELLLEKPRKEQNNYEEVSQQITHFGLSLRPIFDEMYRVLDRGRALILQTKDLRYGDFLIPLASLHEDLALSCGFRLVTRVNWLSTPVSRFRIPGFLKRPRRNHLRVLDTEVFLVFSHSDGLKRGSRIDELNQDTAYQLIQPLWRMPPSVGGNTHKYGSPASLVSKMIDLYSETGDLVLDPFAGYGTTLIEAKRLGRRAIGYELEADNVSECEVKLERLQSKVNEE